MPMDVLTGQSEAFWAADRQDGGAWTRHYWESAGQPWRQDLLDALAPSAPFTSIFEVGCHCGPNYRRLRETFGEFVYVGLDVNASALTAAVNGTRRERIKGEAHWCIGSILTDAVGWRDREFDLVFASSVLSVIAPADLEAALAGMLRLSARLVAIQEPSDDRHNGSFHQWGHDYLGALLRLPAGEAFDWAASGQVLVGERRM